MKNISKIEKIIGLTAGAIILDAILTPIITGDKSLREIIGVDIPLDNKTAIDIITYPIVPAFATYLAIRTYLQECKNKGKNYD